jgi:molecular chaperone GrpE
MRRKIHVSEHGVEAEAPVEQVNDPVAAGDPATDPLGEETRGGQQAAQDASDNRREGRGGGRPGIVEGLEARVAELEAKVTEEHDQYLRAMADFQNFRRRMEEENRRYAQFANEELIRALLPVLDNFERALAAAEANRSFESLMGGVALTLRQLQDLLKKNGVEPIETKGQSFDPNFHEAVERVADSGQAENSIVQELQRGYIMNSRVLRPSIVRVSGG